MSPDPPGREEPLAIADGCIVTPGRPVGRGTILVRGSTIESVGLRTPGDATRLDATGRLVMPGFVDLHGDDLEAHLEPKPGAAVDPAVALAVCDRVNLAAGVTTKLHAVAFEESPAEHRSIGRARAVLDAVEGATRLLGDHRVHARCELGDVDAVDAVLEVLDRPSIELVSLMHHVPGGGQFDSFQAFAKEYVSDGHWPPSDAAARVREREELEPETVREHIDHVVASATAAGVPVASHDAEAPRRVEALVERGVGIYEYPTTLAAVRRASELGATVAMGAPNLVRGGSLWDNVSVREAIDGGTVDVLCSDYHPPSLLHAVFADTEESLPRRVERLTAAPASAVGLDDRGRLEPGHRADVLVVAPGEPPIVERALVGGVEVYRAMDRAPARP